MYSKYIELELVLFLMLHSRVFFFGLFLINFAQVTLGKEKQKIASV